jgi:hypothetical protein
MERTAAMIPRRFLGLARVLLCASLLAACPATLWAQSTGDGSIYSRFGIGLLKDFSSSRSQALGGGGYALRSLNYNPVGNPALWSDQVFTRANLGASFQTVSASDDENQTSQLTAGNLESIQFSFPLYERTLGVGLAFQPYSRSNYKTVRQGRIATGPNRADTLTYTTRFEGLGGLQTVRGGFGWRINDVVRVGASLDVIFGIIESQRSTRLSRPGISGTPSGARDAVLTDGTRLSGITGNVGGHLSFSNVLTDDDALSLGLSFSLPTTLSGERVRTIDESLARDTLGTEVNGDMELPWKVQGGLAYHPDERWSLVLDGLYAPWSTATSDFDTDGTTPSRFPVGGTDTYTDRWRVSVGAEVVPGGNDQLASYFGRTGYRLGAYAEKLYVRPDLETDVHVLAATGGLSLPTSVAGTRIDLNTSVGTRGTTEDNLVRDLFYRFSLHVSIGERWFQERKLR